MEKYVVNKDVCIGCGACAAIAPDVFEINDEGLAQAIEPKNQVDKMDEETREAAQDALEGCPTSAIELTDEN